MPPESDQSHSLSELLAEQFAELRWRRDIEDKLVQWCIGVNVGTLTACVTLAQFAARPLIAVFIAFAWFLLLGSAWRLIEKIRAEHSVYEKIGESIVAILSNEHSFDRSKTSKPFVGESLKDIGKGLGYEKTIGIIRYCTGVTLVALAILFGYICLTNAPLQKDDEAHNRASVYTFGTL